ncbi:hypothetical protein HYFRA_00006375 [Hymenoscyphus fraxineus]|uniref:FAD/NAD(P)-binding domain-containing protein n=1 Tax=Hymenoscyphus fraxineus TaxID=746836 RepID=A0A9N9PPV2_9HELO|nr:hypothetical protein HYFRA_00006375 [Hymenoscyphus fraxineus]
MKTILVLGGSFAGIISAHRLLKQQPEGSIKIILVAPNTHAYWIIAAARAMIAGQIPEEKVFMPIAAGFEKYSASQFEFVLGTAEFLDTDTKNVVVATEGGNKTINYDIAVLATGSSMKGDLPFKPKGSTDDLKKELKKYQKLISNANDIVVGGAGVTGVETAGELAFEYGSSKTITLISSGPTILEGIVPPNVIRTATKQLESLGVILKLNTRIESSSKAKDGREELSFSNGQNVKTDLYLQTVGMVPNTSYMKPELLGPGGYISPDEYLRVKNVKDVWAVGDVSDIQRAQVLHLDGQTAHLAKNLGLVLSGKEPVAFNSKVIDMLGFQVGREMGTGHVAGWRLPSFLVSYIKKTLLVEKLPGLVHGTEYP